MKGYLEHLRARGVEARFVNGRLRIGPTPAVTTDILAYARRHKEQIEAELGSANGGSRPYLKAGGEVVIPHDSDPRYHWWNKGQSVLATLRELGADQETLVRYGMPGFSDHGLGSVDLSGLPLQKDTEEE